MHSPSIHNAKRKLKFVNFLVGIPLEIFIKSEGCNDPGISGCGRSVIRVNGRDHSLHRRGYNVVVVNAITGKTYIVS